MKRKKKKIDGVDRKKKKRKEKKRHKDVPLLRLLEKENTADPCRNGQGGEKICLTNSPTQADRGGVLQEKALWKASSASSVWGKASKLFDKERKPPKLWGKEKRRKKD